MRLAEIIKPNIDKQTLTSKVLRNSFANDVYSLYKDNVYKTRNYSVSAVDILSFNELNLHVMTTQTMLHTAFSIFGQDSETYKIAYFLSDYFSYYDN